MQFWYFQVTVDSPLLFHQKFTNTSQFLWQSGKYKNEVNVEVTFISSWLMVWALKYGRKFLADLIS